MKGIKDAISLTGGKTSRDLSCRGSLYLSREKRIVDRPWDPAAMKLIQKAKVPVIPIYFHAKNSTFFYRLASLSDVLKDRQAAQRNAFAEEAKDQGANWKCVSVEDIQEIPTTEALTAFFAGRLTCWQMPLKKSHFLRVFPRTLKFRNRQKRSSKLPCNDLMIEEVETLPKAGQTPAGKQELRGLPGQKRDYS